jgi:hypothetical protein
MDVVFTSSIGSQYPYDPVVNGQPYVVFSFIDDGMRTTSAFAHWLGQRGDLLRRLSRRKVVYVSDVAQNFVRAEYEVHRRFPQGRNEPLSLGIDHLMAYFEIRVKADEGTSLSWQQMGILSQGEKLYRKPKFGELFQLCKRGAVNEDAVRAQFGPKHGPPAISGHLLEHDYPVWSLKYRRAIL